VLKALRHNSVGVLGGGGIELSCPFNSVRAEEPLSAVEAAYRRICAKPFETGLRQAQALLSMSG